jgi:hypothetical protein
MMYALLGISLFICLSVEAFALITPSKPSAPSVAILYAPTSPFSSASHLYAAIDTANSDIQSKVDSNLQILYNAAETKQQDSETVYTALSDLEQQMRQLAKNKQSVAQDMLKNLKGDWRLVFTTGTAKTQQKFGRINYFPIKAVQSFDPPLIENGIFIGDFPLLKFRGTMEFDLRKRRLEFDFDHLLLLNFFELSLGKGEAAKLGSKSGLGSDSNVKNAKKDKKAFFNWISADDKIATARGGGGGLALWKRVG